MRFDGQYTLVVPTYNRPQHLGRLLRYLSRQRARFPVIVLDSSQEAPREANRGLVRDTGLEIRYLEFDSSIPPFEKFWRGVRAVATPYASFCADDDLLLLDSLDPVLQHLAKTPGCAVAHGWYFTFHMGETFDLTAMLYCGDSIVERDPLERLYRLMRNYEAMTYGVYRTEVLLDVLEGVQCVQTNMARELLGSALAVVAGSAQRLPVIYQGRSMEPSMYVSDWHPIDYIISSPERLFVEYGSYRQAIAERVSRRKPAGDADVLTAIDQIHWRYICDYFKPAVLDYVFEKLQAGAPRHEIMGGMWGLLLAPDDPAPARPGQAWANIVTKTRNKLGVPAKGKASRPIEQSSADGTRRYRIQPAFQDAVASARKLRCNLTSLFSTLDTYT